MMGLALTFVDAYGLAVTQTTNGIACDSVPSGGIAATLVDSGGLPITLSSGILLSASQDTEGDAQGTAIGTLSVVGGTGTYTFTLTNSGGGTTQVAGTNGVNLQVGATAPSIGTVSIAAHADNGAGSTFDATFTISTVPKSVTIDLQAASDTGSSSTDNITSNNSPTFDFNFGSLPVAGDIVNVKDGSTVIVSHTLTPGDISGSSASLGLSALSDGVHSLTANHVRGSLAGAYGSALSITIDTIAPVLSSPSGSQDLSINTEADLSVTTNESTGTLYAVVSTSGTPPTASQIKSGNDSSGSAAASSVNASISSSGAKSLTATGLGNNTYFAHFVHTDAAGNDSSVASSASWVQTVSSWSPTSLAGLKAWYKGDAGVTDSGSPSFNVTQWNDQSGNGFNLTNASGTAFATHVNTLNSKSIISWSGSINSGLQNTAFNLGTGNQFWAFGVARNRAATPGTARCAIFLGNGQTDETNNNASCILIYFPTATQLKSFHNTNSGINNTISQNTYAQVGGVFDGVANTITSYVGNGAGTGFTTGTPGAYGSGSLTTPGKLILGMAASTGNPLTGDVAEIFIGTGTLTGTDLSNIAAYLFSRWGV